MDRVREPGCAALTGIRVLDLTRAIAGPYCTMLLADLGAEVIKLEPPEGDFTRVLPPFLNGESIEYLTLNRNKRSVAVDLQAPGARELFFELFAHVDVVVENFRPDVAERLGVDHVAARAARPSRIYCSISGFGHSGPYRDRPAYDLVVQAMGGGMSLTGEPGGQPVAMGVPIGDLGAGVFGALGILAAVTEPARTGVGAWIDLSMLDVQVSFPSYLAASYLNMSVVPEPRGSGNPRLTPYGVFKGRDGFLVLAVWGEGFWVKLCQALSLAELPPDPRFASNNLRSTNRQALRELIEARLATRSIDESLAELQAAGPAHPSIRWIERSPMHTCSSAAWSPTRTIRSPVGRPSSAIRSSSRPPMGRRHSARRRCSARTPTPYWPISWATPPTILPRCAPPAC
jgi:CoA:oxalate CoA-transferase